MAARHLCPYCGKASLEYARYNGLSYTTIVLDCKHSIAEKVISAKDYASITSTDGKKKLFAYQAEDCALAAKAGFRVLFNHEFGVGKTVISAGIFKAHADILTPALFIVKTNLTLQYFRELIEWTGVAAQILNNGKANPIPGFKAYIVSYDLLKKIDFSSIGIKAVFIDECQYIKNGATARSQAVARFCRDKTYVIATSNTPIKNNAFEYKPILSILDPHYFGAMSDATFIQRFVDYYEGEYGLKFGGLSEKRAEEFRERTSRFIFRRTRAEVLPDLPKIFRQNVFLDLSENTSAAYEKVADKFAREFDGDLSIGSAGIAALSRMRHITGLSKAETCIEHVTDFLLSTDRKLVIFVHHKDVGQLIYSKLNNGPCAMLTKTLQLTSEQDAAARYRTVDEFREPGNRILIASTLASGEGLNLQFCSDAIMLERQWNPANEEQAEGRFPRPGSTADKVSITYMTAIGTIDEYLGELVEKKREYVGKTLDGQASAWSESSLMLELANTLVAKQRKKWSMG